MVKRVGGGATCIVVLGLALTLYAYSLRQALGRGIVCPSVGRSKRPQDRAFRSKWLGGP